MSSCGPMDLQWGDIDLEAKIANIRRIIVDGQPEDRTKKCVDFIGLNTPSAPTKTHLLVSKLVSASPLLRRSADQTQFPSSLQLVTLR